MVRTGEWERAAAPSLSTVPIEEEGGVGFLCGVAFLLVWFSLVLGLFPHQFSGLDSTLPLSTHKYSFLCILCICIAHAVF